MKKNILLLRKELNDWVKNPSTIFVTLVASSVYYLAKFGKNAILPEYFYLLLVMMSCAQCIYGSFVRDKENGGTYFYINNNISYESYMLMKILTSYISAFLIFLIDITYVLNYISPEMILLIMISTVYSCELMFLTSVISDGQEIASGFAATIAFIPLIAITYSIESFTLKLLFILSLDIVFHFIGHKIFTSKYFRTKI